MDNKLLVGLGIVVLVVALVFVGSSLTGQSISEPGSRNYCKLSHSGPCLAGEGDCDKTKFSGKIIIDDDGKWVDSAECKTGWCHLNVGMDYGVGATKDFCECRHGTVWNDATESCI